MQLTRFTDLGLRLLMYLSKSNRSEPITIAEIAAQFSVPHNHLVKVANRLCKLGLVASVRGRNGGLFLAVQAPAAGLGDILKSLEGDVALVNCAEPPCALGGQCRLSAALHEGLQAFYRSMNEYTLADIAGGQTATAIITMHRNYLSQQTLPH